MNFFKSVNIMRFYVTNLSSEDYRVLRDMLENMQLILRLGEKFKPVDGPNPIVVDLINLGI